MSDFRAIQGVSATLKALIEDRSQNRIKVTIAPPDVPIDDAANTRVNLFLYRVTENGNLKNQEIPGMGYPSDYGHPPLSLELYYLVTVLGLNESDESTAQQVLGDVMRILHDYSIITEGLHKRQSNDSILDISLQGEFEKIKITQAPMSLEDITKIWTALTKPYRLSVAYNVSVVQIESKLERSIKRLVGEPAAKGPRVYAVPFIGPRIEEVRVMRKSIDQSGAESKFPFARIGDVLVLIGQNFQGETPVRAVLGPGGGSAPIKSRAGDRIEVEIPDQIEVIVDGVRQVRRLQPGTNTVEIVRDIKMGEPPEDHIGFRSNQASFMLVPRIDQLKPDPAPPQAPQTLEITGSRLIHSDPKKLSIAVIDNTAIPMANYLPGGRREDSLKFNLPVGLQSGNHSVRVRVNGAENIEDRFITIP